MNAHTTAQNSLFGEQTELAKKNFNFSHLRLQGSFISALAQIKYAYAKAHMALDLIDKEKAKAIMDSADAISKGQYYEQFVVDVFQTGSGTSTNMNMNEVVANLASQQTKLKVHPNDDVNLGQSSNDTIPSAIHLSAASQIQDALLPALERLKTSIQDCGLKFQHVVKTGRTHLMDAVPLTFQQELSGYASSIDQSQLRLQFALVELQKIALGGTAIGTGLNAHPDAVKMACDILSERMGLSVSRCENGFAAISTQDAIVSASGQLRTLAVTLLKICHDLRWMNSGPMCGLGEIVLPKRQAGSSIMPGKVNPVIPEAVTMACAQVMGNDATIGFSGQGGNFQLNTMLPLIAYNVLQSIELLTNSAKSLADNVFPEIEVNETAIASKLGRNPILATALNPHIGYEKAAKIANLAYKNGQAVLDVAKQETTLDAEQLEQILNPKNFV